MNKTVNVNLSGIIFHIEEDAYGKLHSYLSTIKGYFSESEGRDEIMADIENRIAEMLSEKVSEKKQVVLMTDIDRVIEVMGKPEDFAGEQTQREATKKEHPTYSTSGKRRRVFRNPDSKILGGVCSGIANYFNIDPLWLRLALVVSFFAFGTGLLLYIVLWIVIPEAKTAGEKLEMRGEDVNFSNIGKKVEEEIHSFGKKAENWSEGVKHSMNKHSHWGDKIADFIGAVFGAFFRGFTKLLGLFLVIIGLIFLLCIGILLAVPSLFSSSNYFSVRDGFNMLYETHQQEVLACFAIFLFIGIPLIMLVYSGVKLLLDIKTKNKFVGIGAGILWFTGLILVIITVSQVASQFSAEAASNNTVVLIKPKCDTLFLSAREIIDWDENRKRTDKSLLSLSVNNKHCNVWMGKKYFLSADDRNIYFGFPTIDINKSESDSVEIDIYYEARGKDRKEASRLSHNIKYEIFQKDSLIEFMPYFSMPKNEKWRNQQVHIEIRIPKGKIVYISKDMKNILHDIHNETNTWDRDMVERRWIMGEDELRCMDCEGLTENKITVGSDGIRLKFKEDRKY